MAEATGTVTRLSVTPVVTPEPTAPAVNAKETATGVTVTPAAKDGETLLAGKFKNAGELETAYVELQKKLGAAPEAATTTPAPTTTTVAPTEEQKAYNASVGAVAVKVAGTEAEVQATLGWARANATAADKTLFDAALASGNVGLVEMAFGTIRNKYIAAVGTQGTRITGEGAPIETGAKPYGTREEMLAVIRSKGYKKSDPAVHAEHTRRMAVTKF